MKWEALPRRPLDPQQGYKPLDFGGNGINGSLNWDGRLIAVNAYHPEHGYVTMTSAPPFPDEQRYQPELVRQYRRGLVAEEGFGLAFLEPIIKREAWLLDDHIPLLRVTLANGATAEAITIVPFNTSGIIQYWTFSEDNTLVQFRGKLWLQRSPYTQLTEGGVIACPSPQTTLAHQYSNHLWLENTALPFGMFLRGIAATAEPDGSITFTGEPFIPPQNPDCLPFTFALSSSDAEMKYEPIKDYSCELWIDSKLVHHKWGKVADDLLLRRGIVYGLNCCIPVSEESTCIITDHMLLPLAWNRDAYYVALMLLHWQNNMAETVRRHLVWMFETAEQVKGFWGRSYLANGKVKDKGFQLDQQLFPLLELADYTLLSSDVDTFERFKPHIDRLLAQLQTRQATFAPLFSTDETSADDPIAQPYALSSHILFWRVLTRLVQIEPRSAWLALAAQIKTAIGQYFVAEKDGQQLYTYATDGHGGHHFYHDANDFPLALAPWWGFCAADDPLWRETIAFAFSEGNVGGCYAGRLGSVHTPAPWSLGEVQDLIIALTIGDRERADHARQQLRLAAQWDGALPEAYAPQTGAVVSRHWFAWANAAYACVELDAFLDPQTKD